MFSALSNSKKISIGEGLGGWSGNKGMRNQIQKESVGMFTKRKLKVGDIQDHIFEAARRVDDVGDGFGSAIAKFPRAKDYQIQGGVDYGTPIATLGPLGKPLLYLNDHVTESVRSVIEPGSRKSVYNIPLGFSSMGKEFYATNDQIRILKGPVSGTLKEELLNITVQPTHVYMTKHNATPFNVPVASSVRDKVNVAAQASYSNANKQMPHSYTENSIKLKNTQPKGAFVPANQIAKDMRVKDVTYTLKNPRLSMSGFEVKAPYYLKH